MFVEDPARNVANTVRISIENIETLIVSMRGPPNNVQEADRLVLQLSFKLRIEEEKQLGSLCKAFSIGLVSLSVSHANRFDRDISNMTIEKFKIGSGLNFSLRQLSSLQDCLGGPVWILGKNQSAQTLGLSINAEDFTVHWGPLWIYRSFIQTERGYLVPVESSGICTGEEIECRWTKQPPRSDSLPGISVPSQLLIWCSRDLNRPIKNRCRISSFCFHVSQNKALPIWRVWLYSWAQRLGLNVVFDPFFHLFGVLDIMDKGSLVCNISWALLGAKGKVQSFRRYQQGTK